jgi:hypothetical protein
MEVGLSADEGMDDAGETETVVGRGMERNSALCVRTEEQAPHLKMVIAAVMWVLAHRRILNNK